jgi:hypothetical protein
MLCFDSLLSQLLVKNISHGLSQLINPREFTPPIALTALFTPGSKNQPHGSPQHEDSTRPA